MSDASIPHIGVLVVDNYVKPARAWELKLIAQNTIRMIKLLSTDNDVSIVVGVHTRKTVKKQFPLSKRETHSCRQLFYE